MKKLAMIGCGGIGKYHLSHFVQFKDIVELAGFCDLIQERADEFVKVAESGKAFTDYKVMLDEIKPDMVFVCVPPTCHGEIEFTLIEKGIHFFVEKPVAYTLELAKEIRDKAAEKGLITASGFQCRYSNVNDAAIKFVNDHPVVYIDCARIGGVPMVWWWRKRSTSLGQIVEQTIHQYDLIRYIFGSEPEEVFTYGTKGFITEIEGYDTEDASTTVVKFKNGTIGSISTGCYATSGAAFDGKITFSARDSRAEVTLMGTCKLFGVKPEETAAESTEVIKGDGNLAAVTGDCITYKNDRDCGVLCDRTFIEAVISGDPADIAKIKSPYEDAVKSLAFTIACNESIDTGKPVKIANED
nr:Gfo/Idh/MocA family oxidoreductase [Clostridia bacterium]